MITIGSMLSISVNLFLHSDFFSCLFLGHGILLGHSKRFSVWTVFQYMIIDTHHFLYAQQ